ncbi:MAG TPA: hypothetical protein VIN60_00140, partial [Anaerolineales bacterium]
DSLLNTIRTILKIRTAELTLQEGSLEWIDNLPDGVLGYQRQTAQNTIAVFLNFDNETKGFQFGDGDWMRLFGLSKDDNLKAGILKLNDFGAVILKK